MSVVAVAASSLTTPDPSELEVTFLKILNCQLQSLAALLEVQLVSSTPGGPLQFRRKPTWGKGTGTSGLLWWFSTLVAH